MDWSAQQAKFGALNQGGLERSSPSTWDKVNAATEASKRGSSSRSRGGWLKWLPTALAAGATLAAAPFTGGTSLAGTAAILGGAAAAGGGLGELGAQIGNQENVDLGNVAQEAAISGATGAIPIGGASKAARAASKGVTGQVTKTGAETAATSGGRGLLSKLTRKAEDLGGRLMNSQTNLGGAEMRRLGASTTKNFNTMTKNYGLSNLDDIAKVAPNVTGGNGIYSKAVESAIGNSKGIDVADLHSVLDDALTQNAVSSGRKKALDSQLRMNIEKMYSQQPLNPLANPLDAFDVAKTYRTQARQLRTGATVTAADQAEANVYDTMAKTLEKKLYSAPGVSEIVPTLKKDIVNQYTNLAKTAGVKSREGKAYLALAKEAEGLTDIASLRAVQKPWVVASKIEQGTALKAGNAASKLSGGGGLVSRVTNPVLDAASPRVGRALTKGSQLMAGAGGGGGPIGGSGLIAKMTREGTKQAVPRVVGSQFDAQAGADPALMGLTLPPDSEEQQNGVPGASPGSDQFAPNDTSQDTGAQLMAAAQHALASGDKQGLDNIMKVYSLYESQQKLSQSGGGKSLNSTAAQAVTDMEAGLASLAELGNDYSSSGANMPLIGKLRGLNPLDTGAQKLQARTATVKQLIGKALEGGVLRKEDEVKYAKILPTLNDTDAVAQYKIQTIANDLQRKLGLYKLNLGAGGGGTDISSLQSQESVY